MTENLLEITENRTPIRNYFMQIAEFLLLSINALIMTIGIFATFLFSYLEESILAFLFPLMFITFLGLLPMKVIFECRRATLDYEKFGDTELFKYVYCGGWTIYLNFLFLGITLAMFYELILKLNPRFEWGENYYIILLAIVSFIIFPIQYIYLKKVEVFKEKLLDSK